MKLLEHFVQGAKHLAWQRPSSEEARGLECPKCLGQMGLIVTGLLEGERRQLVERRQPLLLCHPIDGHQIIGDPAKR